MKQLIVRPAAPPILGYYSLVELDSLNPEIGYALSVAMLPTGSLHAAVQCNFCDIPLDVSSRETLRLETLACSLFLLHVSQSTT